MHASGWDDGVARAALAQTLPQAGTLAALPVLQPQPDLRPAGTAVPARRGRRRPLLQLPDRDVQVC